MLPFQVLRTAEHPSKLHFQKKIELFFFKIFGNLPYQRKGDFFSSMHTLYDPPTILKITFCNVAGHKSPCQ